MVEDIFPSRVKDEFRPRVRPEIIARPHDPLKKLLSDCKKSLEEYNAHSETKLVLKVVEGSRQVGTIRP